MFQSREEAGRLLAERLKGLEGIKEAKGIVLGIPRGGVVVAKVIAQKLGWPLDVVVVKKIGAPGQRELAIGAVAEGDVKVIDWEMALRLGVEQEWLNEEVKSQKSKVKSYVKKFRKGKKLKIKNCKLVILVDDGVATGATVEAAIKATQALPFKAQGSTPNHSLRSGTGRGFKVEIKEADKEKSEITGRRESILTNDRYKKLTTQKLILAIPVGARETVKKLKKMVDEVVVLEEPSWFSAVGQFYREFPEVSDEEVIRILKESKKFLISNI